MSIAEKLDKIEADLPDSRPFFERHFSAWPAQLATLLLFGLVLRAPAFGDTAVHIDEGFYFLAGQWMHMGQVPYVDIWDRKPFGLFLLYYIFAGFSSSVLAYQIPAWLFASLTAFTITRMARLWTGTQGALLAGISYLVLLITFIGIGGQAPVFYNLFIAIAAYLVATSLADLSQGKIGLRVYAAMLLCGIAITIKQTALFESVFLGLFTVWTIWRGGHGIPWFRVAQLAALGAIPTLAIAGFYYLSGHWFEFWQAMVTSNLSKKAATGIQFARRAVAIATNSWPVIILVLQSFVAHFRQDGMERWRYFLIFWFVAAIAGFASVPNLYLYYFLPLLVPAALIMAGEFNRGSFGVLLAVALSIFSLPYSQLNPAQHRQNAQNMDDLAAMIAAHAPRQTLLNFDAPPMLYALSGTRALSPLVFPNHLNHEIERDVSHIETAAELQRIIAARPGAVVFASKPRVILYARKEREIVKNYVRDHCRPIGSIRVREMKREHRFLVFGDCYKQG